MSDLVSILMPCKNAAYYLSETLKSIAEQTYKQIELIVVNDFSTDNSLHLLKAYALSSNFSLKVVNNERPGIINALKLAYSKSSGKYITRMDADDIMHADKINNLVVSLKKKGIGYVATSFVKYFSSSDYLIQNGYKKYETWLNALIIHNNHFEEIYKECVIPSPNWMIDREDLDRVGAFNSNTYPEDYDLCFRFYKAKMKVVGIEKILHYWRDYPERTSRNDPNYADNRFLNLKLKYFLDLDYKKSKQLFIWGTGKKGKWAAKYLIQHSIDYIWISNNANKIGIDIYGNIIQSFKDLKKMHSNKMQVLVLVAGESNQLEIKSFLNQSLIHQPQVYWMC